MMNKQGKLKKGVFITDDDRQVGKVLEDSQEADLLMEAEKIPVRVRTPLRGQLRVAQALRARGFSYAEISAWLCKHGLPIHETTISRKFAELARENKAAGGAH